MNKIVNGIAYAAILAALAGCEEREKTGAGITGTVIGMAATTTACRYTLETKQLCGHDSLTYQNS